MNLAENLASSFTPTGPLSQKKEFFDRYDFSFQFIYYIVSQSHQLPEDSLTKLAQQEVRSERLKALEHRAEGIKEMAPRKTQRQKRDHQHGLQCFPTRIFTIWPKKEIFCGSDAGNPLLGRCIHLAHSGSQSEHKKASSCQLAREFSHIMKGTTCRIKKKFSRRSNSNRKKYQHGTKSIKHSRVLCAFGNVHLHYLLAIETYCAWFHTSSLYKKVSFCKGHL